MPLKDAEARQRYNREYNQRNKEHIAAQQREYRQLNADKIYERNKRYVNANREKQREWCRKANKKWREEPGNNWSSYAHLWRKAHPEIWKAQTALYRAVKKGALVRPDSCVLCGKRCKPQGHHPDYSKPLEVIWLCSPCHKQADYRRALLETKQLSALRPAEQ